MNAVFSPCRLSGSVTVPPSKSQLHRALLCAALADGESTLVGVSDAADVASTIDAITALGAAVDRQGDSYLVRGIGGAPTGASHPLSCGASASTLRFVIPLCLISGQEFTLSAAPSLLRRTMAPYEDICRARGFRFQKTDSGFSVRGALRGGHYALPGNVSSQFISGLLFALPLCDGDSELTLTTAPESRPYLEMTLAALAASGIRVKRTIERTFFIPGNQNYHAICQKIEPDLSAAAYYEAFSALGHDVSILGLPVTSLQGDAAYRRDFVRLAGDRPTISVSDTPDLAPVLMALGAMKNGVRLTDTHRLREKECDRGAAMAEELAKFGVKTDVLENEILVSPAAISAPAEALDGHGDHRVVMALSLLLAPTGGTIRGAEAVRKSVPDFFDQLLSIGAKIQFT